MRALFLITWNDLRQTLSDRALLLLMFAAPLAVASIISVTFGTAGDESSPISSLPLAVVNADRGSPLADFGDQFVAALEATDAPPPAAAAAETAGNDRAAGTSGNDRSAGDDATADDGAGALATVLFDGLAAYVAPDEETGRAWLADGRVSALVLLPEDLSRRLTGPASRGPAEVRLLTRPDREISGDIAETLTRGILDAFAGGLGLTQAAVAAVATVEGVAPQQVIGREAFSRVTGSFGAASAPRVAIEQSSLRAGGIGFNPLVAFGATQAIFFALFTANGNATSILDEERDGTMIRLLASPTPRGAVLAGKLVATAVIVLVQLLLLFVAFTLVGSLLEGSLVFIWGSRVGLIIVVLVATALAAAGLGGIIAAAARSSEQSNVVGTVVNMFMAIAGGAFGFRLDSAIRYGSVVYWGSDAFEALAAGATDVWGNVAVLGGFALVSSLLAYALFRRHFTR